MIIFRFLGFSGRGLSLKLLVLNTQLLKVWNGAERFCLVAVLYMEDGILVNSDTFTDGETWFESLEVVVVVEDFPSYGLLMGLLKPQAQNCAKRNDLLEWML